MNKSIPQLSVPLGEERVDLRLGNGLHVCIAPRRGFAATFSMLTFRFGAADVGAQVGKTKLRFPLGCAHFLEHQMFKKADGDLNDEFASRGAYSNALTTHASTSFHVESVESFEDNLDTLFRLCFSPYFEENLVDRERDIIAHELASYRDHPYWVCYQELLGALYRKHPVRVDIVGDDDSLAQMSPTILERAHQSFYQPSNAGLFIAGDINIEATLSWIDELSKRYLPKRAKHVQRIPIKEPRSPKKRATDKHMRAGFPQFVLGFKDHPLAGLSPLEGAKRELTGGVALDLLFGRGTDFFDSIYSEGLVTGSFSAGYQTHDDFAYAIMGGETIDPEKLEGRIDTRIQQWECLGVSAEDVERKKRKAYGRFLRNFESVESTAFTHSDAWLGNFDAYKFADVVESLSRSDINEFVQSVLTSRQRASSRVLPMASRRG